MARQSLHSLIAKDVAHILDGDAGFARPVRIFADGVYYGNLEPDALEAEIIRGFIKEHFTQIDPETGIPQAGLNANVTFNMATLISKGVITVPLNDKDINKIQIEWVDNSTGETRRYKVNSSMPDRSKYMITFILGLIKTTDGG